MTVATICIAAPYLTGLMLPALTGALASTVAMSTVAAALDATAQAVEVKVGLENKFSINEVIETAATVGANQFEGVAKLAESATKTVAMKAALRAAGESAVVSQLGEMAIGTRPNFDFRQVVAAVSSVYASASINVPNTGSIPDETISNGINVASGAAINTLLYHQDPNFEQLAAQAVGAEIVTVGADVVSRYQTNSSQAQHQQRNQQQMPAEFYVDYEDSNLVSIDANDPRWNRDLTNIASQKRQANASMTSQGETNASTVNYFANPNNLGRFRNTIFGGSSISSQSMNMPQVNILQKQQSSTAKVLSQISVPGGDEFMQSLNSTPSSQHTLWGEVKSFVGREIDFNSKLRQLELMAAKEEVNSVVSDFDTAMHGHGWLRARAVGDIAFNSASLLYPPVRELVTETPFGRLAIRGVGLFEAKQLHKVSIETLDHSAIKFSQSSVNNVDIVTNSMKSKGWVGSPIDAVQLLDGSVIAMDNTRLLAASRANILVKAIVHPADEMLNTELSERFTTKMGGIPATWGEAALNRINKQNSLYRNRYPNGSSVIGAIN